MILVFSRSREANGINEIKRYFRTRSDEFIVAESVPEFVACLLRDRRRISSIFCLASTEVLFSVCALQTLGLKIPVVAGVYHPRQWEVMLDAVYSRTRARCFMSVLGAVDARSVIFNSLSAYRASMAIHPLAGEPHLIPAPSAQSVLKPEPQSVRGGETFTILTVGRYVDFKAVSILRMIEVVERLADEGHRLHYTIRGEGPVRGTIAAKIASSRHSACFTLGGFVDPDDMQDCLSGCDLYFGMGFTVGHSAMLGIPSIIAIQGEEQARCHGFFSDHDHAKRAMFGDPAEDVEAADLYETVSRVLRMSDDERLALGRQCRLAAAFYTHDNIVGRLRDACGRAPLVDYPRVGVLDILKIRLETYVSRLLKRPVIHV